MKSATTKEKLEKFAKEILQNPDLVYELGEMQGIQTQTKTFVAFSEELQETWFEEKNKERFFENLRTSVAEKVKETLSNQKRLSYLTLVKYSYIFTDEEISRIVKHCDSNNNNITKLLILRELSNVLDNVKVCKNEDELPIIIKSAKRIFSYMKK